MIKKRVLALALCVLVLASLFPGSGGAAAGPLSYVAFNDTLPPELVNAAVYYGGTAYLPYWFFTNYGFGISYTYFTTSSTAYVSGAANQIFFELTSGRTYDSNDVEYNAPAILWGGTVYLPLGFMAGTFGGFTYRVIGQNDYGSILRVKTGTEILSDDEFFKAATAVMKRYYQAYYASEDPTAPPEHTPALPEPTENPQPREGDAIRLGLEGMPSAEALKLLTQEGIKACFFLRAEEIRSDPDMVRRIACTGYGLGASCPNGSAEEMEETAALLWETARVRTILYTLPEGAAVPEGIVAFPTNGTELTADELLEGVYSVTGQLEYRTGDQTVLFPSGDVDTAALRMLLYYFDEQGFTVVPLREPDGGGKPILMR
jgi:hypothetical protein